MNIAIVTYTYYPEINPRAFRLFELTKEFCRQGHTVTVFIPDLGKDLSGLDKIQGLTVIMVKPGFWLNRKKRILNPVNNSEKANSRETPSRSSLFKGFKKWLVEFFYMGAFLFEYSFTCAKKLKEQKITFDLMITSALPICGHIAGGLAKKLKKDIAKIMVADYGDPYSGNDSIKPPFFHVYFEKYCLKAYNYVSVPHLNSYFSKIPFDKEKMVEIPQGVNFADFKKAEYAENDPVTFAYAGMFYKNIRNPKSLLDYLVSANNSDFCFIVYTDKNDSDSFSLLQPYIEKLKDKLIIKLAIPRNECVLELSKADFLVNIANNNEDVSFPSKLIDYHLSERPVFNYQDNRFDAYKFERFMNRQYEDDYSKKIDMEKYKIENVAAQFLKLAHDANVPK